MQQHPFFITDIMCQFGHKLNLKRWMET